MKKIITSLIAMFVVVSLFGFVVSAQEETEIPKDEIIPLEEDGGTSPGSPLWGIDRAMERLSLAFTFGKVAKAKKEMLHSRERLLEVRTMILKKRIDQAEKAQQRHEVIMEKIRARIQELKSDDPESDLDEILELEEELAELESDVEKVEEQIEEEVTDLNESEQEKVDNVMKAFKLKLGLTLGDIETSEESLKARIKAKTGKSDEEVETFIEQRKEQFKAKVEQRADQSIKRFERNVIRAEKKISELEERGIDTTNVNEKLLVAQDLLEQARTLNQERDYRGLRETLVEAQELRKEARAGKAFDEKGKERAQAVISNTIARIKTRLQERNIEVNRSNAIKALTAVKERINTKITATTSNQVQSETQTGN